MDAARLVAEAEHAMRGNPQPEDVIGEAWQAFELTEAVGRLLAGGNGARAEAGADRGDGPPTQDVAGADHGRPVVRAGPAPVAATGTRQPRAHRLSSVRDAAGTLRALRTLLGELGLALVALTCTAEDETAYWQCVEALDAVDEAKDRVRALAPERPD
jgi:hypothetical protein